MTNKMDLVMWAKNGASVLPRVLSRIDEVIPREAVNRKIFVDDHSGDHSKAIAKEHGWDVYLNEKGGVGNGAQFSLNRVTCERFISFEQDVVLANNWFEKIPKHLENEDVAVAQGWRISDHPVIGKIDEYSMERFKPSLCSIDNTIYKTRVVRALGGFPQHLRYTGVDAYIHQQVLNAGLRWVTDSSVLSVHLRKGGLREQIRRYYLYGRDIPLLRQEELFTKYSDMNLSLTRSASIALFSPIRGLEIAYKKSCPQALYYYPLIRLSHLRGCLESYIKRRSSQLLERPPG